MNVTADSGEKRQGPGSREANHQGMQFAFDLDHDDRMLQAMALGGWMFDEIDPFSMMGASGDPNAPAPDTRARAAEVQSESA